MTTAPETAPTDSKRPDGPTPEQRHEVLRGRIATLEHAARVTGGAHRVAYASVLARDVVLNRIGKAESLDEVREALGSLDDAGWSDEALPVDDDTRAALAEHLWQQCQRHPQVPGALFEDPRRVAHAAIDFLRALWRLPDPADTEGAEQRAEDDDSEALARIRWWRRKLPADEELLAELDEILAARMAGKVRKLVGRPQPTTYGEAVEAHRELREERRRSLDDLAEVWDAAEAGAVALIEQFAPEEPDEETTHDVADEQPAEPETLPRAWAEKWEGRREALREQLEAGVTDDPEFAGRVICSEGAACPRGIVATFKPRADGSVPMHRHDVSREACAGVGAKPEPLRLADADEEQGAAPDA